MFYNLLDLFNSNSQISLDFSEKPWGRMQKNVVLTRHGIVVHDQLIMIMFILQ